VAVDREKHVRAKCTRRDRPGADPALLAECRGLVLAMVAAWRWDAGDEFPSGREWGELLTRTLGRSTA
jgi:hypothetical protein